jgi:predicted 2-oxoglutarate/Fe(II)-dependent dioxygenase YbiX
MLKIDNFLSKTECETIINMGCDNWLPSLSEKGIILEKYRKSKHISPNIHKGEWLYDITKRCFLKHNIEITADVLKEVQILKYEVGDYIVKHHDTMGYDTNGDTLNRYYALNIILNDDFEGGDFLYYDTNNNPIKIENKSGIGLIFRTNILHEVKPVLKGVRYSFSVFIHPTDFKMKTNLF